jgi:hypothetical protein
MAADGDGDLHSPGSRTLWQEPALLYVTAKRATGFTVRGVTLDGQPAECAFDYRVAAKRLGYEDVRLEEAT